MAVSQGTGLAGGGMPDELAVDVMPDGGLPEAFGYKFKRRLLGPPLVNEQLS